MGKLAINRPRPGSASHVGHVGHGNHHAHARVVPRALGVSGAPVGRAFHPAFGEDLNYRMDVLPDDPDSQVEATVTMMGRYALEDASSPGVGAAVRECLIGVDDSDPWTPIERLFWFVKGRVQFVHDEATASAFNPAARATAGGNEVVEVLVRPVDMLRLGTRAQGDCDDFSMLTASMLTALGYSNVSFVTVAADSQYPDQYSHVYTVFEPEPGIRVGMDTSHGPAPGWECPNQYGKRRDWPVAGSSYGRGLEGCLLLAAGVAGLMLAK